MKTVVYTFVRNSSRTPVVVDAEVVDGDPSKDEVLDLECPILAGEAPRTVKGVRHASARQNRPPYWDHKVEKSDDADPARGGKKRRKAATE